MSAPDTNTEEQERRHRVPLLGIRMGLIYGGGLLAIFIVWNILSGDAPEGADEVVDGRTGEVTEPVGAPD